MLVAQALAMHYASMECSRRAMLADQPSLPHAVVQCAIASLDRPCFRHRPSSARSHAVPRQAGTSRRHHPPSARVPARGCPLPPCRNGCGRNPCATSIVASSCWTVLTVPLLVGDAQVGVSGNEPSIGATGVPVSRSSSGGPSVRATPIHCAQWPLVTAQLQCLHATFSPTAYAQIATQLF